MIASGQSQGIGGEEYYGYHDALYEEVIAAFGSFGITVDGERVQLHRGFFEDTLKPAGAIAVAHIDCDWHDPLRLCLERIHPDLVPGAWVVIDDYYAYGGARRAVDEFLVAHPDCARPRRVAVSICCSDVPRRGRRIIPDAARLARVSSDSHRCNAAATVRLSRT